MEQTSIFTTSSRKALPVFIDDLSQIMQQRGFIITNRESMNLATTFARHDLEVEPDFDLHMIQICKPGKAAVSLTKNPLRAAMMPKFIMAFTDQDKTRIQFLTYGREEIGRLVDDEAFPDSLADTYQTIIGLIEAVC